jgi:hypothetical protein
MAPPVLSRSVPHMPGLWTGLFYTGPGQQLLCILKSTIFPLAIPETEDKLIEGVSDCKEGLLFER